MASLNLELAPPAVPGAAAWLAPLDHDRNRRAHERLMVHELDWLKIDQAQIRPIALGHRSLRGRGAVRNERAAPAGSTSSLVITGRGVIETATFRVLRCQVAGLDGGPVYRGACVFERLIQLPDPARPVGWSPSTCASESVARATDSSELDDALRLIRHAAARPGEGSLGRRVASLLADVSTALRQGAAPDDVLGLIERRLGPELSRIANAPRLPDVDVPRPAATRATAPALVPMPLPAASGSGWNRIVVRYLDGRLLKGFSQDFHQSRPHFHLSPIIDGVTHQPVLVPMPRLKAVFFVRDFEGNPDYAERKSFNDPLPGRRIEITFLDDEVLVGATLGYRPDGTGFFVTPADQSGNNLRIFVLPGAVRHIRYL
jgi:Family of unknown function (DUF6982)